MSESSDKASLIGEFALIDRLCANLKPTFDRAELLVGNGDDAAVIYTGGKWCWVVTCDVQVGGMHFPEQAPSGFNVGHKALAVNISDIAAMGGHPRYAFVSLGIPENTPLSFLDDVYEGINSKANQWNILVAGGNVTRTEGPFFIDVFLVGEVERENILRRSGAKPGDQILVTGYLGDASAGLYLLNHPEVKVSDQTHDILTFAQVRPQPRVAEGRGIAKLRLATAMIDVSDGLAGDLEHICKASGVGAVIWENELPISSHLLEVISVTGKNRLDWALYGGEAYQLLLTAPVASLSTLQEAVREAGGLTLTPIGEIVDPDKGIRLKRGDKIFPLEKRAWNHFADLDRT